MNGTTAANMLKQAEALLESRDAMLDTAKKVAKRLAIDTVAQLYKVLGACEGMFKEARKPLSARLQAWTLENGEVTIVPETETIKGVVLEEEKQRCVAKSKKWRFSLTNYRRFNVDGFKKNSPAAYKEAKKTHTIPAVAFRVDPLP